MYIVASSFICTAMIYIVVGPLRSMSTMDDALLKLIVSLTCRLQLVQNSAARMVCRVKKNDHITPALRVLH